MSEPKRDRFGRYLLTHPETGEEVPWTRVTTFADVLEDSYGLTKWKQRATAVGLGLRPDLLALAQAHTMEDKKVLDGLCEQALTVAAANNRSNLGTAMHRFTERADRGEDFRVPAEHAADLAAYASLKARHGIQTSPRYIERITVVPQFGVAGTMDRIVRMGGVPYIADLKTGDNLSYSWGKIAIQLAMYAHGHGLWDAGRGAYDPMPPVDQDKGLVIQLPTGSGTASLWWVDIAAGWQAAQVCHWVRNWRKNRQLATKVEG